MPTKKEPTAQNAKIMTETTNEPAEFAQPIRSEDIGYDPADLAACPECRRPNAPNRTSCIYCGAEMPITAADPVTVKIRGTRPESWEKAFNIIYLPTETVIDTAAAGRHLSIDGSLIDEIIAHGKPVPAARFSSRTDAEIIAHRLAELGFASIILADTELRADEPPIRLRCVEFEDGNTVLTTFNTSEKLRVASNSITVIVTGTIRSSSNELLEKRKKKEMTVVDSTEMTSDESTADIYVKGDPIGFRIFTKGFDFSGLGAEKGMLAGENLRRLIAKIRILAPNAALIEDYGSAAVLLNGVWEIESQKNSQGIQRSFLGGISFSKRAQSDNTLQFTKYSRLQRYLYEK